ncbi:MAG: site-specific integrase, partial [Candidatus Latescibacteria bacterium]|nr:site-specific integrase [Candidatus Latescibacterota bacterium]
VYRKNDTWWIDYYCQDRRYRQKIGSRRKDAEDALNKIKVKIATGEFIPPSERQHQEAIGPQAVLFKTFAQDEFLPWSELHHSAQHHKSQRNILRGQLLPYFGERSLHEITPKVIEDYISQRSRSFYLKGKQKRPVKDGTVNRDIACIKIIFRKAVEWGKLEANPAREITLFKEIPNPPRLLEQEEVARLIAEVPERLKALIACAVYAGLRREELFHLRWEDLNWKAGELNVISREEHHTKNYESRRIPMNPALSEALRRHLHRLDSPYVFCNKAGNPYDNIRKTLDSAAKRARIDDHLKLHQLRHAFCSHALMQGIDPRTVQKWMGHRDLKTTLGYAHVSPDHEKAAIQRLRYGLGHQVDTIAGQA